MAVDYIYDLRFLWTAQRCEFGLQFPAWVNLWMKLPYQVFYSFLPPVLSESRQALLQAPGGKSSDRFTYGSLLSQFNMARVSYWTPRLFGFQNESLVLQLNVLQNAFFLLRAKAAKSACLPLCLLDSS